MRGSRKFCQRGSNSDVFYIFFLVDEVWGRGGSNTTKSRPLSARQRGVWLVGRWWPNNECGLGSFAFRGSGRYFLTPPPPPAIFCDFSGGGGQDHLPPSPHPRMSLLMVHQSVWTSRISVSSSCPIGFKAGSTWFLPIRGIPKRELFKRLFPIGRLWRLLLNDISLDSSVGVLNWISRSIRETRLVLSSVWSDTWVWYPFNVVNGSIHVVSTGTSLPDLPTRIKLKKNNLAII